MRIRDFMVPKEKVVFCLEKDTIETAVGKALDANISAVVVMSSDTHAPVGIVTKTDMVRAYQRGISMKDNHVETIMSRSLHQVLDTEDRDTAAKIMEGNTHHHAIVVDKDEQFVGLISSWDIAAECAKDARAWPWSRNAEGRFPTPAH